MSLRDTVTSFCINKLVIFIFLIIVLSIGGCYSIRHANEDIQNRMFYASELKLYRQSVASLKKNEFAKAGTEFEKLHKTAKSESIKRHSLYGLAIARLMTAGTPEEFMDAFDTWQSWVKTAPDDTVFDDPRLLEPVLFCRYIEQPIETEFGYTISPCIVSDQEKCSEQEVQIHNLKNKMAALIAEIESLKLQNKALRQKNKEIQALKDKIKALEAIDQNIEKKKTEIITPK